MTKLLNLLIVVLAAALVFVILYPQVQQNRPTQVRIACDSSVTSLPALVGVEESLFAKERIVATIVFYADPDQALADLFAGQYDAGVFPWSTILRRAVDKGETLKVLLSEEFRQPLPVEAIVAPTKSKVKAMTDLRGQRFAYPPQLRDYVPVMLLSLGMRPEDVKLSEVPLSLMLGQLDAGALDAAWVMEPLLSSIDSTRYRTVQSAAAASYVSQPFPGAAFGVSPRLLKQHRLAGGRLKVATDAAVAFTETKSDTARAIVGRYFQYCSTTCGYIRLPEMQRLAEANKTAVTKLAGRLKMAGVLAADIDAKGLFVDPATLKR
jgi:NitT/TauT family transport system substrate-binding protein